jgi:hypothetical protein
MKRTAFVAIVIFIFLSCTTTDPSFYVSPDPFPNAAETKSPFDNTSFGVYKGVIFGSSGTIVIRINNGDNIIKGYLSMDNTFDTLSASQPVQLSQPIVNLNFTGRFSSMNLSADADGSHASLSNITINGHDKEAGLIVHENSSLQVQCFEGTFTGGQTGIINLVKIGPTDRSAPLYLLEKFDTDTVFYRGTGALNADSLAATHYFYDNGNPNRTFSGKGKFINDSFSGSWSSSSVAGISNGTFDCRRTW